MRLRRLVTLRRLDSQYRKKGTGTLKQPRKTAAAASTIPTNQIFVSALFKAYQYREKSENAVLLFNLLTSENIDKHNPMTVLWSILILSFEIDKDAGATVVNRTRGGAHLSTPGHLHHVLKSWTKNRVLTKAMDNDIGLCAFNTLIATMMMGGVPETLDLKIIDEIFETYFIQRDLPDGKGDMAGHYLSGRKMIRMQDEIEVMTMSDLRRHLESQVKRTNGIVVLAATIPGHAMNVLYNCETKKIGIMDLNYLKHFQPYIVRVEEGFFPYEQKDFEVLNEQKMNEEIEMLDSLEIVESALSYNGTNPVTSYQSQMKIVNFMNTFRIAIAKITELKFDREDLPPPNDVLAEIARVLWPDQGRIAPPPRRLMIAPPPPLMIAPPPQKQIAPPPHLNRIITPELKQTVEELITPHLDQTLEEIITPELNQTLNRFITPRFIESFDQVNDRILQEYADKINAIDEHFKTERDKAYVHLQGEIEDRKSAIIDKTKADRVVASRIKPQLNKLLDQLRTGQTNPKVWMMFIFLLLVFCRVAKRSLLKKR